MLGHAEGTEGSLALHAVELEGIVLPMLSTEACPSPTQGTPRPRSVRPRQNVVRGAGALMAVSHGARVTEILLALGAVADRSHRLPFAFHTHLQTNTTKY